MQNKFIFTVQEENKELDELENLLANNEISEDAGKVKLENIQYKNRYALYFALNINAK